MSATAQKTSRLPESIRAMKGGTPIVSLTAYTTPMAQMMDAHCDFVLVGDSVGMVLYGRAVARGLRRAMLVVDMPFGSNEESKGRAFRNAGHPVAGTGAAAGCDGQILVVDDMLGPFTAFRPKFVKRYAHLSRDGEAAIAAYAEEARARGFPAPEHVFADKAPSR